MLLDSKPLGHTKRVTPHPRHTKTYQALPNAYLDTLAAVDSPAAPTSASTEPILPC